MPDRIIRESICSSDTIDKLSWFEEVFWHRLTVNCDDFGRFDARPEILKGRLFPLKDGALTKKSVENALNRLATVGLVTLYVCDGRPYLQLVTWEKYQRRRATKSKFPDPPANDGKCCQVTANAPVFENRESTNENRESGDDLLLEAETASSQPPVISIILNDKTYYPIYQSDVDLWTGLYAAVDVMQELRNYAGWADANPQKRKTKSGIKKSINAWLAKEQNKGGKQESGNYSKKTAANNYPQKKYSEAELSHMFENLGDV